MLQILEKRNKNSTKMLLNVLDKNMAKWKIKQRRQGQNISSWKILHLHET